jgi:hypothetical protein
MIDTAINAVQEKIEASIKAGQEQRGAEIKTSQRVESHNKGWPRKDGGQDKLHPVRI